MSNERDAALRQLEALMNARAPYRQLSIIASENAEIRAACNNVLNNMAPHDEGKVEVDACLLWHLISQFWHDCGGWAKDEHCPISLHDLLQALIEGKFQPAHSDGLAVLRWEFDNPDYYAEIQYNAHEELQFHVLNLDPDKDTDCFMASATMNHMGDLQDVND